MTLWVWDGTLQSQTMPGRKIPIVTGEIYHVVNRGIASQPTFTNGRDYQRMLMLLPYYRFASPPFKLSKFLTFPKSRQVEILQEMQENGQPLVDIIAYCLMPNHFHLVLKQISDESIAKFVSDVSNGYTRYFNTKYERKGPIFQGKFKAVRVEGEEQLLHLSRYVHLNPFSSYIVKAENELEDYPYSSFSEYVRETSGGFCQKQPVLSHFETPNAYRDFILDRADYQRELQDIKHLTLDDL